MKIPDNLELYYGFELRDAKGKVTRKVKKRKCHSFVKAFAQFLYGAVGAIYSISIVDTGNSARTMNLFGLTCTATAGTTTYGTVVGTGTNAVTISDYALQTKIAHGTGASQLQYSAESFGAPTSNATSSETIATRVFTNASGSAITVTEIGLYTTQNDSAGTQRYFCIIRDILVSSIEIAIGGSLTLNYTIKATV